MSLLETVLVDGTDLSTLAQGITDLGGVFDTAPRRGSNYVLPGSDGGTYVAKPLDALTFSLGIVIQAKDPSTGILAATDQLRAAQLVANYRTLVSLTKAETGGTITLTRKLSTLAGSSTSETCTAECVGGIKTNPVSNSLMRVVVNFVNLSGKWA